MSALCAAALACGSVRVEEPARAPEPLPSADAGPSTASDVAKAPAPGASQRAPEGTEPLVVEGFLPALVSWPDAEHWPQPVLVAAHGAGDHAESHCELWRKLLVRRGVVLCLRGRALSMGSEARGYFYADHHSLRREALAALTALTAVYPGFVDGREVVYAGYSQGAQMGSLMLAEDGARAPRLLLVEGGAGDWSAQRSSSFSRSGGRAVALVCGTRGCNRNAQRSHRRLLAAGIRVTTHYVPGAGHTYLGPVIPTLVEAFAGLTKDDQRWAPAGERSAGQAPGPSMAASSSSEH